MSAASSCCMCGAQIEANAMNMCASCIATEVDVAEGIDTECELVQCRGCLRFQSRGKGQQYSSAGGAWLGCDWESKELMALCLKSIPGLSKAKLIDAGFIWTEPHSKRVKLRLTLQREVANHAVVQNTCVITFVIHSIKCPDCTKQYHNNTWRALVQIRQKAEHKRTFLRLEQEILKHNAHQDAIGITAVKEGMDFYFGTKSTAERFIHFLSAHVPMRSKSSSKLISENVHNSTANLQLTYSVELSPICKDDLLVLPRKFAQSCGNISDVTLCARTTSMVHLLDPVSGQRPSSRRTGTGSCRSCRWPRAPIWSSLSCWMWSPWTRATCAKSVLRRPQAKDASPSTSWRTWKWLAPATLA